MTCCRVQKWQALDGTPREELLGCDHVGGGMWITGAEPTPRRKSETGRKGIVHEWFGLQHDRRILTVQKDSVLDQELRQFHAIVEGVTK